MDVAGFAAPWAIYLIVLLLHASLPARTVAGYVRDPASLKPLGYRLNGVLVLGVMVTLWALAATRGWLPYNWLWTHRWGSLLGACTLGVVFTLAMVLPAPSRGGSLIKELYLGRLDNPRVLAGRIDIKMALYLVGAVMLELNLLSFTTEHVLRFGATSSAGVLAYTGLFSWFVFDYLLFEQVHLYTYDLFAERVGFKLGWGCLAFYPFFYAVGLWDVVGSWQHASEPKPPSISLLLFAAICFFVGWGLSRGANLQKFQFKRAPTKRFFGIAPTTVSDGTHELLCSGLWGLARHINYLGEVLMAVGLTLSLGEPTRLLPWLYPLYYLALLVPRERDDNRRCAAKYGELWQRYCDRVRYRIIPGIY